MHGSGEIRFSRGTAKRRAWCGHLLIAASLLSTACSKQAVNVNRHKLSVYKKVGVTFDYPKRWRVTEGVRVGRVRTLCVESPENAIVLVHIASVDAAERLWECARWFSDTAKEKTSGAKISRMQFGEIRKLAGGDEILVERFVITSAGEEVPHTRFYQRRQYGDKVCVLISQVADEDRAKAAGGFDFIISSFRCEDL